MDRNSELLKLKYIDEKFRDIIFFQYCGDLKTAIALYSLVILIVFGLIILLFLNFTSYNILFDRIIICVVKLISKITGLEILNPLNHIIVFYEILCFVLLCLSLIKKNRKNKIEGFVFTPKGLAVMAGKNKSFCVKEFYDYSQIHSVHVKCCFDGVYSFFEIQTILKKETAILIGHCSASKENIEAVVELKKYINTSTYYDRSEFRKKVKDILNEQKQYDSVPYEQKIGKQKTIRIKENLPIVGFIDFVAICGFLFLLRLVCMVIGINEYNELLALFFKPEHPMLLYKSLALGTVLACACLLEIEKSSYKSFTIDENGICFTPKYPNSNDVSKYKKFFYKYFNQITMDESNVGIFARFWGYKWYTLVFQSTNSTKVTFKFAAKRSDIQKMFSIIQAWDNNILQKIQISQNIFLLKKLSPSRVKKIKNNE